MQLNSFELLPTFSNLVRSNGSKNVRNVMQMALKWLFFAKKLEKLPSGWGFDPNLYGLVLQGDTTEAFFEQNFVLTF